MPDWMRIFPDADHRWIMGLRPGEPLADFFADRDSTGAVRGERAHWLAEDAQKYAALLPEAEPALCETLQLTRSLGTGGADEQAPAFEQLLELGRSWEPDFVWMHPQDDGVYRLIGGVVCFPSSWALRDKLGLPMSEVHEPVPDLNATIGHSIDKFLAKQAPGAVWRRDNWNFSRDAHLNHHPSRPRRQLDATISVEEVQIRLEHQLFLKLPESGSVLFGIRIELVPLTQVVADPQAAARFARLISTMTHASAAYKGAATARPALLAMLRSAE